MLEQATEARPASEASAAPTMVRSDMQRLWSEAVLQPGETISSHC